MYRYLSHDTIEMMTEDADAGFLNREFIESKWFPVMYDLNDWTPFLKDQWVHDYMVRIFVKNGVFLILLCDEEGLIISIGIVNDFTTPSINIYRR